MTGFRLTTDAELANEWGLTLAEFHRRRRRKGWPCVQLGRSDFRFTDAQIAQIVGMQSIPAGQSAKSKGKTKSSGQTKRSQARSA